MDRNYKRTAREAGLSVDKVKGDDMLQFPIKKARARGGWLLLAGGIGTLVGFGWAVERKVHPAVLLVLQFIMAFICTYFFQTFNTLLVDIFPDNPSTAAAAGNVSRCAMSGFAVAALQPIVDRTGRGWFFTGLAVILTLTNVTALGCTLKWGEGWRKKRIAKRTNKDGVWKATNEKVNKQDLERGEEERG